MADERREPKQILGFQFEPERKNIKIIRDDAPNTDSESDWDAVSDVEEDQLREARCKKPVESWCMCKHCKTMEFEVECKCCHELQSAHVFELRG